jgi:predicted  nucleic acid-binding Zn-ribbon protein
MKCPKCGQILLSAYPSHCPKCGFKGFWWMKEEREAKR